MKEMVFQQKFFFKKCGFYLLTDWSGWPVLTNGKCPQMLLRGETRPVASQNVGCFLRLYIYLIEAIILFTTYKVKKVERMWLVLKNIFLEFGKLGSSFSERVTSVCSFNSPFHCFFQLLTWTSVG